MRTPSPLSSTTEWVPTLSVRALLRWCGLLLCVMACWVVVPTSALAQGCYTSAFGVAFGTVSTSTNTDVTASLPYNCQANARDTYYKVCFFMPGGTDSDISGVNPRRMKDYNGHYINYNLYSDPARTQIIGPPPTGGGYPVYSWDFVVPGGWSSPARTVSVFGRVPPVPVGTATGSYQAQGSGGVLQYAWSNSGIPSDCFQTAAGGGGSPTVGYNGSTATVSNSCTIAISQASDMDFGTVDALASAITSTSQITLACPNNTAWRVGLNDGLNAVLAGQRRMAGPTPDFLDYELYRDVSRTQRWGNDTAGGTNTVNGSGSAQTSPTVLTVYGRVPTQTLGTPGVYADTITVTLTY